MGHKNILRHYSPDEVLYHDADHFFQSLNSEIRRSQKSIWMEFYTFEFDSIGKSIIKNLSTASQRGIDVRLIVDGIGSSSLTTQQIRFIKKLGIKLKVHHPLPWQTSKFASCSISEFFNSIVNINKRNHRKLCLFDQKILYVGSINMSQLHSRRFSGDFSWRDNSIRVSGKPADLVKEVFELSWQGKYSGCRLFGKTLSPRKSSLRINHTKQLRKYFQNDLLYRLKTARKRIWITTPYFVPDNKILQQLNDAANRGIDVRILIPRKSDMRYFPLINSLFFRLIKGSGVKIYEYLPTVLHAKNTIIDDWVLLGSSNLNSRSYRHDLEIDYVPKSQVAKNSIIHQFSYDLQQSRPVELNDIIGRYMVPQIVGPFFKLIRYWL
ncbi:MAG: cardiolipin synthase B [Bdellovibrio sp. CG12_big_fil_rev_8_21_14_0_65_39_13]|nr:MAG: cardiolipin synthase B [Bdellovibrio sp. CG22_combo_CG10-13_8_21_14_all_39_27]PIQ62424.1 MAG: cardiolipin synthase B [Bdellovibrio sp. CG12_big_fil_rev_8_21_14_0_65_39_13]PIR34091.1 MAG: cardiolipin synthase B [Bdellovibrio sp. CG11_big_fil_rev_8_21_14_0_20_39_38]PJB53036.1 MAG: cardiolipin synthase B [Bdellovibrio sp. CG_4_9_14_3_um_filter_39_7]